MSWASLLGHALSTETATSSCHTFINYQGDVLAPSAGSTILLLNWCKTWIGRRMLLTKPKNSFWHYLSRPTKGFMKSIILKNFSKYNGNEK